MSMFNTPLVLDTLIGLAAVPMLAIGASRVMPSVAEVEVEVIVPPVRKILPAREVRVISLAVILFAIVRSPVVTAKENSSLVVKGSARGSNVLVVADSRYAFCASIAIGSIPLLPESSTGFVTEPISPIGALRVMPPAEVEVIVPLSCKILPAREVRVISLAVMPLTMVMSPISAVIEITPVMLVMSRPGSRASRSIIPELPTCMISRFATDSR